jgi:hypothetical protein
MPIINFSHDKQADGFMPHYDYPGAAPIKEWPEGAMCPLDHDNQLDRVRVHGALVLWYTHVGMCLHDYEINGYSDSDFRMIVWNPELEKAEDICFASTRGWSYPSYGSKTDASPEIIAKYEAWKKKESRIEKAHKLMSIRKRLKRDAQDARIEFMQAKKLSVVLGQKYEPVIKLLKTKNFRSQFRQSLNNQVREWLNNPENRKFPYPLSSKQLDYLQ